MNYFARQHWSSTAPSTREDVQSNPHRSLYPDHRGLVQQVKVNIFTFFGGTPKTHFDPGKTLLSNREMMKQVSMDVLYFSSDGDFSLYVNIYHTVLYVCGKC